MRRHKDAGHKGGNKMLENKLGMSADKAEKGYLSGMMVFEFFSPNMPAIAASAGVDFLMYDMEHTGTTTSYSLCWTNPALFRG